MTVDFVATPRGCVPSSYEPLPSLCSARIRCILPDAILKLWLRGAVKHDCLRKARLHNAMDTAPSITRYSSKYFDHSISARTKMLAPSLLHQLRAYQLQRCQDDLHAP